MSNALPKIGRYEVVTRLATGGMAELFLAREQGLAGLERIVVLKRILPHLADKSDFVDMFLREARIVARLNHPNVVQIYELGEENGIFFLTMEYIHGSTVRELQILAGEAGLRIPLEVSVGVVRQGLRGLQAAHDLTDLDGTSLGLVHRDISPHNLMCTPQGHVKLLDFGVAKATSGLESTYSGNLKGKFSYMSPEQCRRMRLDHRSDIFSMGVVFWELVTGQRLFKRGNELDIMQAITSGDIPRPSALGRKISAQLEDALMMALNVDRNDRFDSADAMRKALTDAATDDGMNFGEERIASFISTVAREQIQERGMTLQNALERNLTQVESQGLLHATGSNSAVLEDETRPMRISSSFDFSAPRLESGSHSKSQQETSTPGASGSQSRSESTSLSVADHSDERPTDEFDGGSKNSQDPRSGQSPSGESKETRVSPHKELDPRRKNQTAELEKQQPGLQEDERKDDARRRSRRRRNRVLRLVALTALLGAIAGIAIALVLALYLQQGTDDRVLLGETLTIGWAPTVDPDQLESEIDPLRAWLEDQLSQPVQMVLTRDYDDLSRRVRQSEVDFGVLPPLLLLRTLAAEPKVKPLVVKEFDGSMSSDGLLLVRASERIRTLDDLQGETFCFVDPSSTSGYFLPRAWLRAQGKDPDSFVGNIHWSGDHTSVLRDLLAERCKAAATYSGSFLTGAELGIPIGQFRQFAITGNIPQDTLVASPRTSGQAAQRMATALQRFDPRDLGVERLGETQVITGFAPADDRLFDDLRLVIKEDERSAEEGAEAPDAGAHD